MRGWIAGLSAFAVMSGAILAASLPLQASPKGARWNGDYFPHHTVQDQDGNRYSFFKDLIEDKIVVIDFMYTTCTEICPLTSARMAEVQERLGDRLGKDIFIYSITLEPEVDTPELLKLYAGGFDAKPGWLFLTGTPDEVKDIRYKLGERSRKKTEHRTTIVLGNDKTGEWRRSSIMADLKVLVDEIFGMDPAWRPQMANAAANIKNAKSFDIASIDRRGEAFFLKACSYCHSIGEGDRIGPDLSGLLKRRDRDWLERYLTNPPAMVKAKDPIAVALDEAFQARMPDLGLNKSAIDDLLAYIESHERKADTPSDAAEPPHDHAGHDHAGTAHKQGG